MLLSFLLVSVLVGSALCHTEITCPGGGSLYEAENLCLRYMEFNEGYSYGVVKCKTDLDGDPVFIKDQNKDDFITDMMTDEGRTEAFWIGVDRMIPTATEFKYNNGDPLTNHQPWNPVTVNSELLCVVRRDHNQVPLWDETSCDDKYDMLCQHPPTTTTTSCDSGWHLNKEADACVKPIKRTRLNFEKARSFCQDEFNGDLATKMVTRSQRRHVKKHINFRAHFWIGVHSPAQDEIFKDIDDLTMDDSAPFKRKGTNGHCVSMRQRWWYTKSCDKRQFFICQKDPTVTTT